jgi:broad specificity phosphatase PhoE
VVARVASLLEELAVPARGGEVIVVSHVSPIKAGVAWALGVGVEASWRMSLAVSSVTRIVTSDRGPALLCYGETGHLAGA